MGEFHIIQWNRKSIWRINETESHLQIKQSSFFSLFVYTGNMRIQNIVSACCCLALAISLVCADDTETNLSDWNLERDPRFDARISELLAKNVMQLSQEIGTAILQDSDKPTEVISPLSIYTALSILLMGSNKQTFGELMSLLKINNGKLVKLIGNFTHFRFINNVFSDLKRN